MADITKSLHDNEIQKSQKKEMNSEEDIFSPDISNIHIIGTSHIAKDSVKEIEIYLDTHKIDVVCVELDKQRLFSLQNNVPNQISLKNIGLARKVGLTGFIFALIASHVQKSLGTKVGTKAGSDMLAAVKSAAKRSIPVALVDQDVTVTLAKLSKYITFKEKMRMIFDMFKGLLGFKSDLLTIESKELDFSKVPSEHLIETVLEKTKDRYPGFYRALVGERNSFMINRIYHVMKSKPQSSILVVIGAGHKEGMVKLLEHKLGSKYDPNSIKRVEKHIELDEGISYSYGYDE